MIAPTKNYSPFIESDARDNAEDLRARMREMGYLFFRALVPVEAVLQVRRDALQLCREAGWLDPTRDLMDGIAAPDYPPTMESQPDYMPIYRRLLRISSFHDFPTNESLIAVGQKILDVPRDDVFVHPRRIGRITFPHLTSATTPPHQDHYYIRGAVDTYSCWTPLGECPLELGGLAVAPASQRDGFLEHNVESVGAVGGCGLSPEIVKEWHTGDFGVGDTLFFHSFTIHKALPNLTEDRLRISTDNRYQRPKEDIEPASLLPHYEGFEERKEAEKKITSQ